MPRRYQVVVYHHIENGMDEKREYETLQEAEKVARGYVDGTMEDDGFAYEGAAVYDLLERRTLLLNRVPGVPAPMVSSVIWYSCRSALGTSGWRTKGDTLALRRGTASTPS